MRATMPPKQRKPGRPKGTLTKPDAVNVNAWLRSEIGDAFAKYIADARPQITRTAAVEMAIEEFLIARGYLKAPER